MLVLFGPFQGPVHDPPSIQRKAGPQSQISRLLIVNTQDSALRCASEVDHAIIWIRGLCPFRFHASVAVVDRNPVTITVAGLKFDFSTSWLPSVLVSVLLPALLGVHPLAYKVHVEFICEEDSVPIFNWPKSRNDRPRPMEHQSRHEAEGFIADGVGGDAAAASEEGYVGAFRDRGGVEILLHAQRAIAEL